MKFGRLDDEFVRLAWRLRRVERLAQAARFVGALRQRQRVWIEELPSAGQIWCVDANGVTRSDGSALAGR